VVDGRSMGMEVVQWHGTETRLVHLARQHVVCIFEFHGGSESWREKLLDIKTRGIHLVRDIKDKRYYDEVGVSFCRAPLIIIFQQNSSQPTHQYNIADLSSLFDLLTTTMAESIIGIDLGTTFSCVACWDDKVCIVSLSETVNCS
jgi:hypothetical protein